MTDLVQNWLEYPQEHKMTFKGHSKGEARGNSLGQRAIFDRISQVESQYGQYIIFRNHYDIDSLISLIGNWAAHSLGSVRWNKLIAIWKLEWSTAIHPGYSRFYCISPLAIKIHNLLCLYLIFWVHWKSKEREVSRVAETWKRKVTKC